MSLNQLKLITSNALPHEEYAPRLRNDFLAKAVADVERKIEEAFNRPCPNCGAHEYVFEPRERDDGAFVSHQFARIASCLADEKRLMGEGLVTTAGAREML